MTSCLGGEVYAFGEMLDNDATLRVCFAPFGDLSPGTLGLEACEGLFAHPKTKRAVAGEYLVRLPGDLAS